jgi:hypothetical protein
LLERAHERTDFEQHRFIAFTQPRRDDVLARHFAPEIVAAVTSGVVGRDKIHPVSRIAACHSIPAITYRLTLELNSAFNPSELDSNIISFAHFFLCTSVLLPGRLYP